MNTPIQRVLAISDHNPNSPSRKRLALDASEEGIMGTPVTMEAILALIQSENAKQSAIIEQQSAKQWAGVQKEITAVEARLEAKLEGGFQTAVTKLDEKWGGRMEQLDNMVGQTNDKIASLTQEKDKLTNQLEDMENKFRRNNLIFTGLSANNSNNEDCIKLVTDLCVDILGIPDVYVNRANKLPINKSGKRDIVAHLPYDSEIQLIMKNAPKLKGRNIFIRKDLVGHAARVDLWFRRFGKSLREMKVYPKFGVGTMFIGNKRFTVARDRDTTLMCGKEDGCALLSEQLKIDIHPIWYQATATMNRESLDNGNGMD